MEVEDSLQIVGTMQDIMEVLAKAIVAGYGNLPATLSIRLYLARN